VIVVGERLTHPDRRSRQPGSSRQVFAGALDEARNTADDVAAARARTGGPAQSTSGRPHGGLKGLQPTAGQCVRPQCVPRLSGPRAPTAFRKSLRCGRWIGGGRWSGAQPVVTVLAADEIAPAAVAATATANLAGVARRRGRDRVAQSASWRGMTAEPQRPVGVGAGVAAACRIHDPAGNISRRPQEN
jgi:hypothetical protein